MHHFYVTRATDGKRVETTRTIGMVSRFPREAEVWAEVGRGQQAGSLGPFNDGLDVELASDLAKVGAGVTKPEGGSARGDLQAVQPRQGVG